MRWLLVSLMPLLTVQHARCDLPEVGAEHSLKVFCNNVGVFPARVVAFYPPKLKEKKEHLVADEIERATILAKTLMDFKGDPDVLMLQEIWSIKARDHLIQQLAREYPHVEFPDVPVPRTAMMMASGLMMFSKHPLSGFAYRKFTKGIGPDKLAGKGIIGAWLTKDGRRVAIFTTHLQAGKKKEDPTIRPDQMRECNEFIRDFLGDEKESIAILAGDFNTHSTDPDAYGTIFTQLPGFRDTYKVGLTLRTQTGRSKKYPNKRIDYFLTLGAENAISTIVDPTGPTISDHLSLFGVVGLD